MGNNHRKERGIQFDMQGIIIIIIIIMNVQAKDGNRGIKSLVR